MDEREYRITLGRHAQDVLSNPAFEKAMEDVMTVIQARFLATSAAEEHERLAIWAMGQHANELYDRLRAFQHDGRIEEENKRSER